MATRNINKQGLFEFSNISDVEDLAFVLNAYRGNDIYAHCSGKWFKVNGVNTNNCDEEQATIVTIELEEFIPDYDA